MRRWEQAQEPDDPHREIHPKREYVTPDLTKVPLEPDPDILFFIAEYNPYLQNGSVTYCNCSGIYALLCTADGNQDHERGLGELLALWDS